LVNGLKFANPSSEENAYSKPRHLNVTMKWYLTRHECEADCLSSPPSRYYTQQWSCGLKPFQNLRHQNGQSPNKTTYFHKAHVIITCAPLK
jgi:hypothetical protein